MREHSKCLTPWTHARAIKPEAKKLRPRHQLLSQLPGDPSVQPRLRATRGEELFSNWVSITVASAVSHMLQIVFMEKYSDSQNPPFQEFIQPESFMYICTCIWK